MSREMTAVKKRKKLGGKILKFKKMNHPVATFQRAAFNGYRHLYCCVQFSVNENWQYCNTYWSSGFWSAVLVPFYFALNTFYRQ